MRHLTGLYTPFARNLSFNPLAISPKADVILLASAVYGMLVDNGFSVVNIDATVIAQKPKLQPFIEKMRANIAFALNISVDAVNIKATTEEHLGFTGREEGISAHAVALIEKNKAPSK